MSGNEQDQDNRDHKQIQAQKTRRKTENKTKIKQNKKKKLLFAPVIQHKTSCFYELLRRVLSSAPFALRHFLVSRHRCGGFAQIRGKS